MNELLFSGLRGALAEFAFPLFGLLIVFGVILPIAAIGSKLLLWVLNRREPGVHAHRALRYALLIAPTLLPLAWFVAACIHQTEGPEAPGVCAVEHADGAFCPEAALLAGALMVAVALFASPGLIRDQISLRVGRSDAANAVRARIATLLARMPSLNGVLSRCIVSDRAAEPISTRGVFSPRVVVDAEFASRIDDAALAAALLHEAEHVKNRDPLRYFVAWWAIALNPLGAILLGPELKRWIVARETHCDRDAVLSGASASALAHALVVATRHNTNAVLGVSSIRTRGVEVLRLRIDLLMAYCERPPHRCCEPTFPLLRTALATFGCVLVFSHSLLHTSLDVLHEASEDAAAAIYEKL